MNKLILILGLIYMALSSMSSCDEVEFTNNSKLTVEGKLVDENDNPVENYPIIVGVSNFDTNFVENQYPSITNYEIELNKIITDENGNFKVYFPETNYNEFLFCELQDSLEFYHADTLVRSPSLWLRYTEYKASLGTIKLIQP